MISNKRGCYWCKLREGLTCTHEHCIDDFAKQLRMMGWKVSENSLKKPLSDDFNGKAAEELKHNRRYGKDTCIGCECSRFKQREQMGFVFR